MNSLHTQKVEQYLLQSFIFQFTLLARNGILVARAVPGIDNALAQSPEAAFTGHQE